MSRVASSIRGRKHNRLASVKNCQPLRVSFPGHSFCAVWVGALFNFTPEKNICKLCKAQLLKNGIIVPWKRESRLEKPSYPSGFVLHTDHRSREWDLFCCWMKIQERINLNVLLLASFMITLYSRAIKREVRSASKSLPFPAQSPSPSGARNHRRRWEDLPR